VETSPHLTSAAMKSPAPVRSISDHRPSYFLDCCYLCRRALESNADIYMYRGNTAFCSEECRQEEMDRDEAKSCRRKPARHSGGSSTAPVKG
ncbi:hypothetical protein M569_13152, partial [Genlisea aurea]